MTSRRGTQAISPGSPGSPSSELARCSPTPGCEAARQRGSEAARQPGSQPADKASSVKYFKPEQKEVRMFATSFAPSSAPARSPAKVPSHNT